MAAKGGFCYRRCGYLSSRRWCQFVMANRDCAKVDCDSPSTSRDGRMSQSTGVDRRVSFLQDDLTPRAVTREREVCVDGARLIATLRGVEDATIRHCVPIEHRLVVAPHRRISVHGIPS
jgi:hypothetical protein